MPLYEYQCSICGRITEELAPAGRTEIPCSCGKGTATRRLSAFSVTNRAPTPCGGPASSCGLGGDTSHAAGCSCCGGGRHRLS